MADVTNINNGGYVAIQAGVISGVTVQQDGACGHVIRCAGSELPCDLPIGRGGWHSAELPE